MKGSKCSFFLKRNDDLQVRKENLLSQTSRKASYKISPPQEEGDIV